MPPVHVRAVARRIFLVQLYIAQQSRPYVASFHKVMAQDPVLGKAPVECPLERIDIIYPLTNERAFVKEILINVGDGARIRVDARLTPEQVRVPRRVRALQTHGDEWLKDAVPFRDTLFLLVVPRTIERVRHGS